MDLCVWVCVFVWMGSYYAAVKSSVFFRCCCYVTLRYVTLHFVSFHLWLQFVGCCVLQFICFFFLFYFVLLCFSVFIVIFFFCRLQNIYTVLHARFDWHISLPPPLSYRFSLQIFMRKSSLTNLHQIHI